MFDPKLNLINLNLYSLFPFYFPKQATPISIGIVDLYHDVMGLLVFVIVFVFYILYQSIFLSYYKHNKHIKHVNSETQSYLETLWTVIPGLILFIIAIPSMSLLYAIEEPITSVITIQITGKQWYWSYNTVGLNQDFNLNNFDSCIIESKDLNIGDFRLLEVDNRLVLPALQNIKLLITSDDVIHCWSVPSFGIKVDACPGRLAEANVYILAPGIYYGQCSEICGVGHAFMPITVVAIM